MSAAYRLWQGKIVTPKQIPEIAFRTDAAAFHNAPKAGSIEMRRKRIALYEGLSNTLFEKGSSFLGLWERIEHMSRQRF